MLIYFAVQNYIGGNELKKIKREYSASEKVKMTYVKGLVDTINKKKELSNSFYKSTNVISLSEYNTMFYELVDRQVNGTIEKNKVKKLTLKKR